MWSSYTKAWITRILFVEWMNMVFGPEVKERNLPLRVLLVMDNAPAHLPGLELIGEIQGQVPSFHH